MQLRFVAEVPMHVAQVPGNLDKGFPNKFQATWTSQQCLTQSYIATLNVQPILVLLLAIAPLPHLPQFGATSEDDEVPTSLQDQIAARGIKMAAVAPLPPRARTVES